MIAEAQRSRLDDVLGNVATKRRRSSTSGVGTLGEALAPEGRSVPCPSRHALDPSMLTFHPTCRRIRRVANGTAARTMPIASRYGHVGARCELS
jgi:hypothetical protein